MTSYSDALAFLDTHSNYDLTGRITSPSLDRIQTLMSAMGDPQRAFPVIHVTGTNGKGSTTQMITRLLMAHGLTVGTYTSPHLERINERINRNCEAISDDDFAEQIAAVANMETLTGVRPTYFETVTAAAFRWMADVAVDVAVVEVGLLGRWDATNVCEAQVAVLTNIGIDHTEYAGPTKRHIAIEKSGIVKPSSAVVIGETDPELAAIFANAGGASSLRRPDDFDVLENQLALGGRMIDLRTPTTVYPDVFVPLHGRHQGDNAVVALTAAETFFASPIDGELVTEGFSQVVMPGRFEVMGHQPLVIIDGAHNAPGADTCASVFFEDFDPAGRRILVVGCLQGRDPREMLSALRADEFDLVVTCTAPSSRGMDAGELTAAARAMGCDDVIQIDELHRAIDRVLANTDADDAVLITGSLYVVGAARPYLRKVL
ncbi:MAG TPA: folylpolyglutamate synthase/dihydrofolate synthase family protein [Ilumatobacteraceae bacterium]|nr:folylpolyglutamate synthase/dihydrofolate synthase family protein [Ilumatobacteraceae bacterium]